MKKLLPLSLLLLLVCLLQGCSMIYSTATDERLMDTMSSDKLIASTIKKNLMSERMSEGWDISVFCYYGHVFLVGECPKDMRGKAVEIAKKDKSVRSVTTHWFEKRQGENNDFALAARLRANLIGTSNLNNTRIDTAVNANRVVLLGVASDAEERKTAVRAAREQEDVDTVTSYIMLPLKEGQNPNPTGITYKGFHPPKGAKKDKAKQAPAKESKGAPLSTTPKSTSAGGGRVGGPSSGVQERDI